jgi:hypothetical protein
MAQGEDAWRTEQLVSCCCVLFLIYFSVSAQQNPWHQPPVVIGSTFPPCHTV